MHTAILGAYIGLWMYCHTINSLRSGLKILGPNPLLQVGLKASPEGMWSPHGSFKRICDSCIGLLLSPFGGLLQISLPLPPPPTPILPVHKTFCMKCPTYRTIISNTRGFTLSHDKDTKIKQNIHAACHLAQEQIKEINYITNKIILYTFVNFDVMWFRPQRYIWVWYTKPVTDHFGSSILPNNRFTDFLESWTLGLQLDLPMSSGQYV